MMGFTEVTMLNRTIIKWKIVADSNLPHHRRVSLEALHQKVDIQIIATSGEGWRAYLLETNSYSYENHYEVKHAPIG